MIKFRQIIQNFAYSGELTNTTVIEWLDEKHQGDARNATAEDMTQISDAAAAGYLAQIEALNAEIAELKNPANPPAPPLLSELDAAFEALPEEVQSAFEPAWVIVRNLIQAGKSARAYRFVQSLDVPESLESVRTGILAKIAE